MTKFREWLHEAKIAPQEKKVVAYIKKEQKKKPGTPLAIFGVHANDIIKMIEQPGKTHKWDNDYFNKVEKAFDKLSAKIK